MTDTSTIKFENSLEIAAPAKLTFDYVTSWRSYGDLSFPFAKPLNLPSGQMQKGQEIDVIFRYFLFFKTWMFFYIEDIDASALMIETYSVQPKIDGMYTKTSIVDFANGSRIDRSYALTAKPGRDDKLDYLKFVIQHSDKQFAKRIEALARQDHTWQNG